MPAAEAQMLKLPAIRQAVQVVWYRAFSELRAEATRTYAGYLWWILQPLLMFCVYYVAFNYVLRNRREDFAVYLFSGIILWQWFSASVQRSARSLISARSLMLQVNLHKSVFPFSIILINSVKFLVTLGILFVVLMIAGDTPSWVWLMLPLVLIVELIVIAGFGCFTAMLSPFIPDFQHILTTVLHLAFFLSGIVYDLANLPERVRRVLAFNPMAMVIEQARAILLHDTMPDATKLIIPVIMGGMMLVISFALLHRFDKVYPKIC